MKSTFSNKHLIYFLIDIIKSLSFTILNNHAQSFVLHSCIATITLCQTFQTITDNQCCHNFYHNLPLSCNWHSNLIYQLQLDWTRREQRQIDIQQPFGEHTFTKQFVIHTILIYTPWYFSQKVMTIECLNTNRKLFKENKCSISIIHLHITSNGW